MVWVLSEQLQARLALGEQAVVELRLANHAVEGAKQAVLSCTTSTRLELRSGRSIAASKTKAEMALSHSERNQTF